MALDVEGRCYTWGRNDVSLNFDMEFVGLFKFLLVVCFETQELLVFAEGTTWSWG